MDGWKDDLPLTVPYDGAPTVVFGDGLLDTERTMLNNCWSVWQDKYARNSVKQEYYTGHNLMKNLGLAFPNGNSIAKKIHPVSGWPAKAVNTLSARSQLDYFTFSTDYDAPELRAAYDENDMELLYMEMCPSELAQSCAFVTVTKGGAGDPDVVVSAYSALNGAGVWDRRRKRIAYGMTITDTDDQGNPIGINLFTPDAVITLLSDGSKWYSLRMEHSMGRPLIEPFRYNPTLDKPMGTSRISRAVMSITDNAVREVMRSEVAGEVYTIPQRYFLGLDPSKLRGEQFSSYWNSYMAITSDSEGLTPQAGQFNPPGMQDHVLYMKSLAAQFAGETGVPVSSLGVIYDNPSSAEAIYAGKEDLVIEAEHLNITNGASMKNVAKLIMATARNVPFDGLDEVSRTVKPHFNPADRPSVVSMSDAILKQIQAIPALADTDVALEQLGYSKSDIRRIHSETSRSDGKKLLETLAANIPPKASMTMNAQVSDTSGSTVDKETPNEPVAQTD